MSKVKGYGGINYDDWGNPHPMYNDWGIQTAILKGARGDSKLGEDSTECLRGELEEYFKAVKDDNLNIEELITAITNDSIYQDLKAGYIDGEKIESGVLDACVKVMGVAGKITATAMAIVGAGLAAEGNLKGALLMGGAALVGDAASARTPSQMHEEARGQVKDVIDDMRESLAANKGKKRGREEGDVSTVGNAPIANKKPKGSYR